MKYKYNVNSWGGIEKVEVEKETDSSVWVKGRRNQKVNSYSGYFDTIEEAKTFVIGLADAKILEKEKSLAYYQTAKEELIKKIAKWDI